MCKIQKGALWYMGNGSDQGTIFVEKEGFSICTANS